MEGNVMKKIAVAAASLFVLSGLAACGESAADKAAESRADAVEAQGEARADQLEAQADAAPTDAQKDALNRQADQVEENADRRADQIEQQGGNADGGMTTHNTPTTN
jgi:hypothetical protein